MTADHAQGDRAVTYQLNDYTPRVVPAKYKQIPIPDPMRAWPKGQAKAYQSNMGLRVILSMDELPDGQAWLHASVSYERQLPRWRDLKEVHEVFMLDRPAVQIIPPKKYWLNMHPYCLHLWSRLDQEILPGFVLEERP